MQIYKAPGAAAGSQRLGSVVCRRSCYGRCAAARVPAHVDMHMHMHMHMHMQMQMHLHMHMSHVHMHMQHAHAHAHAHDMCMCMCMLTCTPCTPCTSCTPCTPCTCTCICTACTGTHTTCACTWGACACACMRVAQHAHLFGCACAHAPYLTALAHLPATERPSLLTSRLTSYYQLLLVTTYSAPPCGGAPPRSICPGKPPAPCPAPP